MNKQLRYIKKLLTDVARQPVLLAGLTYTPLEPLPGQTLTNGVYTGDFSQLVGVFFNILLSIGAMIAVVTLVFGGITYMVSEIVDKKTEARKRMQTSIMGLLLLLTSWLILHEINPNLTQFNLKLSNSTYTPNTGNSVVFVNTNDDQTKTTQSYYDSKNGSQKVIFATAVGINDTESINNVSAACSNSNIKGSSSFDTYVQACKKYGAGGAAVGFVATVGGAGVLGIAGAATGATIGCLGALASTYISSQPSIDIVPNDTLAAQGKIIMSCNY